MLARGFARATGISKRKIFAHVNSTTELNVDRIENIIRLNGYASVANGSSMKLNNFKKEIRIILKNVFFK